MKTLLIQNSTVLAVLSFFGGDPSTEPEFRVINDTLNWFEIGQVSNILVSGVYGSRKQK